MESQETPLCSSLDDIRDNIDKIDTELVKLIAKRSKFVSQAVHFKKSTAEVLATDRIDLVISKVRALAEQVDLNPIITEKVYRTMINTFIIEELTEFDSLYKEIKQSYY
ncbi:chorismate mutase [Dysgonomonas sp. Marseille-P4677]|uniref:chorismate mutase n=1 Tax=Dysgonomonas sp. Marseille-P4677 TaxID=2364790 RepID=UPI001911F458|nr:chorismate mutase [Dysgonomonas sp. Marseille-P4677]MBK5720427.1 chorismate mutase [Dysgonomonas sp. Marseille-P4677]